MLMDWPPGYQRAGACAGARAGRPDGGQRRVGPWVRGGPRAGSPGYTTEHGRGNGHGSGHDNGNHVGSENGIEICNGSGNDNGCGNDNDIGPIQIITD